jgi:hypothetical protein
VWYKQSYMLGEWLEGLKSGKGTVTAWMLLVPATSLLMSPVEMPLSETDFDRNISVHTQLDSSEYFFTAGGTLWPHRPDVVIVNVSVHNVVVGLHAFVRIGLMAAAHG